MPSTYSNLKIQLMAAGENTTTWGNVTNINMGTAIEEAIVGSATVTFADANQTLSLSDTNATQTARNMRLNLTGTATAGYNLVVPAIQKPYIVNNGTDGTITVKNSTGTGIAVPAGKTMWVYNNGTDVVDAVTHLSSLTLGTPLAIAQGGTGANSASAARTALGTAAAGANSDITSLSGLTTALSIDQGGTGANSASAARTALGTAASGANSDITSLSGLSTPLSIAQGGTGQTTVTFCNLQTNVTGTLPIANGGTGATSASTARSALGAAASGANSDITSLAGLSTALSVAQGGTGQTTTTDVFNAFVATGASLANPGYIKLQNGLYVMWGSFTATANFATSYNYSTISGSISLSSFSIAVASGGAYDSGASDNWPGVVSCSTTGFTVYNAYNSSVSTFFIAIGY